MIIANTSFDALPYPRRDSWLRKAELLQSKGYHTEKDVYKLAELMYNAALMQANNMKEGE